MINKIGVENFRVFKNYTEFELRPLTLLTGPNNAGKSSLTKLLLLLNNGFQQLNFKKGKHNLEDFDKILNWENDSQELLIKIDYQNDLLNEDFYYEFKYINSDLHSISIKNNEVTLLTFIPYLKQETVDYLKKEDEDGFDFDFEEEYDPIDEQYQNFTLSFNINYLIDSINNYNIKFYNNFHGDFINKYRNKDLENDNLLYRISHLGIDITDKHKEVLLTIQEEVFNNLTFGYDTFGDRKNIFLINELFKYFKLINKKAKELMISIVKNKLHIEDITIKNNSLANFIFEEISYSEERRSYNNIVDFESKIFLDWFLTKNNFRIDAQYISPMRGNQKRVLGNKSDSEIDETVAEFYETKNNGHWFLKEKEYLTEILEILEVDGIIDIERQVDTISVLNVIRQDGKKVNLADLGFGYSQVIPIILKIINCMSKKYNNNDGSFNLPTIIIEEPEANLHPNLQSKLADIFAITLKYIPYIKFVIETHSEYFIRKLQYLTAKNEIAPNQSVIYYFNADKYVTAQEPKVKKIEINNRGSLSDTFGPGFYDETARLQFDFITLRREQSN